MTAYNRRVSDRRKPEALKPDLPSTPIETPTPVAPEMAAAENDNVPEALPEWFDAAMVGGLVVAAIILFTIIYQVLTWH